MRRVFGALAIVILAGCAAAPVASDTPTAVVSPAGTPSARPTTLPVPSPTPTPTPSPAPATDPPTPSPGSIRFVEVATFDDLELYDVAAFDGGYVAGGCHLEITDERVRCGAPVLLHSADGRRWDPVEVPGSGGTSILAVVATPIGLLALGTDHAPEPPGTRSMWRSEDGVAWQPFDVPAPSSIIFETAAVLGTRTILFGSNSAYDLMQQTEAWATNGQDWSAGETPMGSKVVAEPGLVAIGEDCAGDVCPEDVPLSVYRSGNGFDWTEDQRDPSLQGGTVGALGSFGGRAVMAGTLGNESDATSVVWIDEPQGWRAVPLDGGGGGFPPAMLEVGDDLVVVAQSDDGGPDRAWSTADGRTWTRVPIEGIDGGYVVASADGDSTVIVVDYDSIRIAEH